MVKIRKSILLAVAMMLLGPSGWAGPVDINSANAETLAAELNGVGLAKARAIVAYRDKHGTFASAADLTKVKGIGDKVVLDNQKNIRLGEQKAK